MRDDFTCQYPDCGQNHNLDAAHIISRRQQPELALFVPNGVTLCRVHHDYLHRHPKEWRAFIALVMERRGAVTQSWPTRDKRARRGTRSFFSSVSFTSRAGGGAGRG